MAEAKMTKKNFYEAVIAANLGDELTEFAKNEIAKLEAAKEKARNTPTKTQKENAPLVDQIVNEILTNTLISAADIAAVLNVSTAKATALAKMAVADGRAVVESIKEKGKPAHNGYKLADKQ